jgi:hypothetical protein
MMVAAMSVTMHAHWPAVYGGALKFSRTTAEPVFDAL